MKKDEIFLLAGYCGFVLYVSFIYVLILTLLKHVR